jgi:integrase/recombinase XerD
MQHLQLKHILYKEENRFALYFEKNDEIIRLLRTNFPQMRWSNSQRAWILPFESKIKSQLFQLLRGRVWLDYSELKQKQEIKASTPKPFEALPALRENQLEAIARFRNNLNANRYSENTVKTYVDALAIFLRFSSKKEISEISNLDVEHFNNEYILKNNYSESFQNQVVNALKLFFRVTQEKTINIELLERPRREHRLPNILSKEEVKAIINAPINIKHKMMLTLIYACGLRRSELLNLTLKDIHSNRNLIMVRQSKGKKDRIVPIGNKLIESLREYYILYKPKKWLFEGQTVGVQYSEKSLQNVLKQSLAKCRITKPVTLHWLRHSYATHLLESGTDLRYIQELLGHNSSRTTEIYTHVSTKNIQNIVSPFDSL